MKKVLITGSLGYIGSVLAPYLKENGFDCLGYDTGFFKDCLLYPSNDPETIIKDMRDFSKSDLDGVNTVVHLTGISNDPFKNFDPEKIYDPTRIYSLKIAELCKELGIKFIFASSCSVYGKGEGSRLLDESSKTFPQTPYSLNKLQIENDLKRISDKNFSPIILRFATLFGISPRHRFDLVINMFTGMAFTTKKIILNSDGMAWRPHVHINDVCKAIKLCVDLEHFQGPLILNVGDVLQNYQIIQIAQMVKNEIPGSNISFLNKKNNLGAKEELIRDRKIQDGVDARTYKVSFDAIKKYFPEFKCDWTIQKGVKEMANIFKKMDLTEKEFTSTNYYRLQKFEYMLKNKLLSKNLKWLF